MAYIGAAVIALFVLFGWCFVVNNISLSEKGAKACRLCLFATAVFGVFLCILSGVIFAFALAGTDADSMVKAVVRDSYIMFIGTDSIFIGIGLFISLAITIQIQYFSIVESKFIYTLIFIEETFVILI